MMRRMPTAAPAALPPVVFEDDWLIAFNKPSGLRVAPDRWDKELPCLMTLIHQHLSPAIFNVHRIDADTSGLVLCAKTRPALADVTGQFQNHKVTKRYLAIVLNAPPQDEMEIVKPLEENPQRPGTMQIGGGKRALARTRLRVLERWRRYCLLEAVPVTGKTHQIRVHLAAIGCPILADPLYGAGDVLKLSELKPGYKFKDESERPLLARLALHAESLELIHPGTKAPLTLRAPLPKDMAVAIKYLNRFCGTNIISH
jgi:RluA family pseudouridine synthase